MRSLFSSVIETALLFFFFFNREKQVGVDVWPIWHFPAAWYLLTSPQYDMLLVSGGTYSHSAQEKAGQFDIKLLEKQSQVCRTI